MHHTAFTAAACTHEQLRGLGSLLGHTFCLQKTCVLSIPETATPASSTCLAAFVVCCRRALIFGPPCVPPSGLAGRCCAGTTTGRQVPCMARAPPPSWRSLGRPLQCRCFTPRWRPRRSAGQGGCTGFAGTHAAKVIVGRVQIIQASLHSTTRPVIIPVIVPTRPDLTPVVSFGGASR